MQFDGVAASAYNQFPFHFFFAHQMLISRWPFDNEERHSLSREDKISIIFSSETPALVHLRKSKRNLNKSYLFRYYDEDEHENIVSRIIKKWQDKMKLNSCVLKVM